MQVLFSLRLCCRRRLATCSETLHETSRMIKYSYLAWLLALTTVACVGPALGALSFSGIITQPTASYLGPGGCTGSTPCPPPSCGAGCFVPFCVPLGNATIGATVNVAISFGTPVARPITRIYDSQTNGVCVFFSFVIPTTFRIDITEVNPASPVVTWFGWVDPRESYNRAGWPYYYDKNYFGNVIDLSLPGLVSLENAFAGNVQMQILPSSLPPIITSLKGALRGATAYNGVQISSWNTANVRDFSSMFRGATAFNQPLSSWNVTQATNMDNMFFGAVAFSQDLTNWCVTGITSEPTGFRAGAPFLFDRFAPTWGFCRPGSEVSFPIHPYPRLNTFCAGPLINPGSFTACQYLLQAGLAMRPAFFPEYVPYNNMLMIKVYMVPNLPEIQQSLSYPDAIAPGNASYAPGSTFVNAQRTLPAEITFRLPYCMRESISVYSEFVNNIKALMYSDSSINLASFTGTGVKMVDFPETPLVGCEGDFLLNYDSPCSDRVEYSVYDMHCNKTPTSFQDCVNNQQQVELVFPSGSTGTIPENVTSAPAAAVFDNLGRSSLFIRSKCSNRGTNVWKDLYGDRFGRLRGTGMDSTDPGQQSPFWGSLTYKFRTPATCAANMISSSRNAFYFQAKLLSTNYTRDSKTAIPVTLRYTAGNSSLERTAYVPFLSCEPSFPRTLPTSTFDVRPIVQPFCRVSSPNPTFFTTDALPDGSVIYKVWVQNLPLAAAKVWVQIKFEYPTDSSLNEVLNPLLIGSTGRTLAFVIPTLRARGNPAAHKVYAKFFSPDNAWQFIANEADITGIPMCDCSKNIPCGALNQVFDTSSFAATIPNLVSEISITPQCTLFLLDGYQGSPKTVLRNRVHRLGAKTYPEVGNSYVWDASLNTPGSVTLQDQDSYSQSIPFLAFRVNTKVQEAVLRMRVTTPTGVTNFCSLAVSVEEGAPVAQVSPAGLILSVGTNATLDGSASYSTTEESIYWLWEITFASNSTGLTLVETANVTTNTVVGIREGSYRVTMFVCTIRTCRGVSVPVRVVQGEVIRRNVTSTNCVSSLSNAEELDPIQPPIPRASVQIFALAKQAANMFSLESDYRHQFALRAQAVIQSISSPEEIRTLALAGIALFTLPLGILAVTIIAGLTLIIVYIVKCARVKSAAFALKKAKQEEPATTNAPGKKKGKKSDDAAESGNSTRSSRYGTASSSSKPGKYHRLPEEALDDDDEILARAQEALLKRAE